MQEDEGASSSVIHRNNPKKRSLLGMFGKRVSRVEPDPRHLDTGAYHSEGELTPVMRRSRSKNHNNNNNISSSSSEKSKAINRLSGNFTFCCASGVANALSPIEANDVPVVRPNIRPRSHLKLELDTLENWNVLDTSKRLSVVNATTASNSGFSYKPLESEHSSSRNEQQEISLQKPITESKSRFRNRYLPRHHEYQLTGAKKHYQDTEMSPGRGMPLVQHSSTPDIAQAVMDEERRDLTQMDRKSVSFDTLPNPSDPTLDQPRPASADSLARQALMAAHVLHLIPTEKAKQRNFFQGQLGANPLLGPAELDRMLPSREIKIFVGTWNMNGQNPPSQLNDLVFPNRMEHVPDIIALGTQESTSERYEWEVLLQETLGPSHVLLHSAYLGTLHLAIFLRRDLIWFCSVPEDDSFSVRPGTAFRTKGAVAISFCIFGTSLLFITSHLTAHQQKVKERVQDVKRIIHALDLPRNLNVRHKSKDVTTNFDCVFFCGDLNFRLSEPRSNLLKWIETTQFPLPEHLPHGFLHTDQLTQALSDGAAFKGFREAKITFPPTYKYDPGTQQFDTSSKQRAPAYTDRILYKFRTPSVLRRSSSNPGITSLPVICLAYDSVNSIVSSDHKPVWALFKCQVRPGIDSVPLAAGLFNRDVYLEGMRRRLNNTTSGSSAVCTIQ